MLFNVIYKQDNMVITLIYKTKKNKNKITPHVVEIVNESPPKLQELLNEIVRIIDVIRDSFKK